MDSFWRIELLGWLRLVGKERVITRFRTRKVAALLAYLAYHSHRSHAREELIELFWPEGSPEASRRSLRVALASLRRQLEPPGTPPSAVLVATRASVRLNPDLCITDVALFEGALQAAAGAEELSERMKQLAEAASIYRGDLLPGAFDDWILAERQRLLEAHLKTLDQLASGREKAEDWHGAIQWARRAVRADPLSEEAHQRLIRLLAAAGQPEAALRQYRDLERLLRVELRAAPEAALRTLARELEAQIAAIELPAGPAAAAAEPRIVPHATAALQVPPAPPDGPPVPGGIRDEATVSLPVQLTRFFGREAEIERLRMLLAQTPAPPRLVTLTGPGGTGKTRLALEAAARAREQFAGRIAFVPLLDLAEPGLIPGQILDALRVPRAPSLPPIEQLVAVLSADDAPALLLLDNFEQLLPDGAAVVQALLERIAGLTLWVTSRQTLGLPGEQELRVDPLPVPEAVVSGQRSVVSGDWNAVDGLPTDHCALITVPSVQLFLDRAQAVRADFQLTPGNAAAVAGLCAGLEGIPLAIELAAARIGILTPAQMLARLGERFGLLTTRRRMPDRRHQSLWTALDWSYQFLTPDLQQFFARLSVFRGGWTLEAAEAVCSAEGPAGWAFGVALDGSDPSDPFDPSTHPCPTPTLDLLQQLRESSLVLAEEGPQAMRYRLLETMREFGAEKLAEEERFPLSQRHAAYFLALAETADPKLRSAERLPWAALLDQEHDNIRAALAWCLAETDGAAHRLGLRLAAEIAYYWHLRCHWSEGWRWLESVLALPESSFADAHDLQLQTARAKVLSGASFLAWHEGDNAAAQELAEESAALWRRLGNKAELAPTLIRLGKWILDQGDRPKAVSICRKSVSLCREVGDDWHLAWALTTLSDALWHPSRMAEVRPLMEEALRSSQRTGDLLWIGLSLGWLASISREEGDVYRARALNEESSAYHRQVRSPFHFAAHLTAQGIVVRYQGDYAEARSILEEALGLHRSIGQTHGVVRSLNDLGLVALARGEMGEAHAHFEEALALVRSQTQRYPKPGLATCLGNQGRLALAQGEYQSAASLLEQSLAIWRELDNPRAIAETLGALGNAALGRVDLTSARELLSECLAQRRAIPDRVGLGDSLCDMARLAHAEGNEAAAEAFYRQSLAFRRERGDRRGVAESLEGLAQLAAVRHEPARAAQFFGAAEALRERIGAPLLPHDCVPVQRSAAAARAALGEKAFAAEWAHGRAASLEQTIASLLALQ